MKKTKTVYSHPESVPFFRTADYARNLINERKAKVEKKAKAGLARMRAAKGVEALA